MMNDIREEARAEAEKRVRESPSPDGPEVDREYVSGFVNGVHWADARKVEATASELPVLIDRLYDDYEPKYSEAGECVGSNLADAILAAGYRKVEVTVEVGTVEDLPVGSVVLDDAGDVWQRRYENCWCSYETAAFGSERLAHHFGPFRVLYRAALGGEQ